MKQFLTVSAAARVLKLSENGVRHIVGTGELPVAARTQRNTLLFRAEDVEAVAAARRDAAVRS